MNQRKGEDEEEDKKATGEPGGGEGGGAFFAGAVLIPADVTWLFRLFPTFSPAPAVYPRILARLSPLNTLDGFQISYGSHSTAQNIFCPSDPLERDSRVP